MRLTLTYPDRSKIEARLHQVCKRPEGSAFAVYLDHYSDELVAIEMTESLMKFVNKTHVSTIRKGVIGPLREARTPAAAPEKTITDELHSIWCAMVELTNEDVGFRQTLEKILKRLDALEAATPKQGSL